MIEASLSDRFIFIGITDQGPGISPGKEKEVFRQHATFRQNSRDGHSGTGLFLAAKIIRKIGGTVSARNGERGGALLLLTLPRQI